MHALVIIAADAQPLAFLAAPGFHAMATPTALALRPIVRLTR